MFGAYGKIMPMQKRNLISILVLLVFLLMACNQQPAATATLPPANIETYVAQTLEAHGPDLPVTPQAPGPGTLPTEPAQSALPPAQTQASPGAPLAAELLLWAPAGSDPALVSAQAAALQEYANSHGMRFLQADNLSSPQLGSTVKVVVSLAPAEQTLSMAEGAAQTEFLSLRPLSGNAPNLYYAASGTQATSEQVAFLAGYTLGLVSDDFRTGVLYQADDPAGKRIQEAFTVGTQFYCGLCNSRFAPVTFYPKSAGMSSAANYQSAADELLAQFVNSVYIQPEVSSPELVNYLTSKNIQLIGVEGQAGLSDAPNWVAVLASEDEPDLTPILDALFAGNPPPASGTGLNLTRVNPDVLTMGKLRFIEATRLELLEGKLRPSPYGP